jgi:hypothetical protein
MATMPAGDLNLTGMRYTFTSSRFGHYFSEVVFNCFVLPNGKVIRDMDGYAAAATSERMRAYGGAELQVVADEAAPAAQRDEMIERLLTAYEPIIKATASGVAN